MKQCGKILFSVFYIMLAVIFLAAILRVFVCDQFEINGESMSPTLVSGDHVLVNKLLMGARIYAKYDFSDPDMESFRMPGIRKLRPGDIAVFNYPQGRDREKIEFRINYVYAKRCIGCPEDTVRIVDGHYSNSRLPGILICPAAGQKLISSVTDAELKEMNVYVRTMPYTGSQVWTVRDFGPLYIPGKGSRIRMDTDAVSLYGRMIEYETGVFPEVFGDRVYLDGVETKEYEFKGNWYFFGGDNVLNSKDSRYIGLVPEEYIVGIATRIIFTEHDDGHGRVKFMGRV